jgi:hypothetical protein
VGIGLHDVPEDRAVPDGDHGLGAVFGFFTKAGAFSAAENDGFHGSGASWRKAQSEEGVKEGVNGIVLFSAFLQAEGETKKLKS